MREYPGGNARGIADHLTPIVDPCGPAALATWKCAEIHRRAVVPKDGTALIHTVDRYRRRPDHLAPVVDAQTTAPGKRTQNSRRAVVPKDGAKGKKCGQVARADNHLTAVVDTVRIA